MMLHSSQLQSLRRFAQFSFIVLAIIIAYIAFLPNYEALPEFTSISDILNHFAAFFVLTLFLDSGFQVRVRMAFLILLFYGLFIELVQYFLPNRHFDLLDIIVDLLGCMVYYLIKKIFV